jgi:hypothetical protein
MKKYIILISVILLLSANKGCTPSCNKDELPTYLMDENFKSYVDFPVGSYWTYQEISDIKLIDSIYLFKREYFVDNSGTLSYNSDLFSSKYSSSYYKDTSNASGSGIDLSYINIFSYREFPLKISLAYNTQYFSGEKGVGYIYTPNDASKILYKDSLAAFTVNSVSYPQVKVFENLIKNYDRQPRVIHYAKNVGVIRKELFNGQIWELQRYFIKK